MLDKFNHSVIGILNIRDRNTKKEYLNKCNAIHFGNLNLAFAKAVSGDPAGHISFMSFGNGGAVVSGTEINYKVPRVSNVQNLSEQLYSTTFVQKMSNLSTNPIEYDNMNFVSIPTGQSNLPYKDIVATVTLSFGDNGPTGQNVTNNGSAEDSFVFDEIALYAGPATALSSNNSSDPVTIQNFINNSETAMITHVIFSPIEKAQNVELEIIYTIRIQAGVVT